MSAHGSPQHDAWSWSPHALRAAYDGLLPLVEKPARYIGGERGTIRKPPAPGTTRVALAFPDVYEIGQSHLGLQILYDLLNSRQALAAERVFAPWLDMESQLRRHGLPLASLESCTPLAQFDILGFSLQYELTYTNILAMLDLGGIPLLSRDRTPAHPLVIGGGPGAFNPEPIADFFDAFVLGDGEEAILDVCAAHRAWNGADRTALLERLSRIPGVYVPSYFAPRYNDDGTLAGIDALRTGYELVEKRVLRDLNDSPVPRQPIVPNIDIVHERPSVEVMRGCVKGCRFCQAGYVYRPQRERHPREVVAHATRLVEETGFEEVSLLSLSTGDYSCINPVLRDLMNRLAPQRVAVSLPSTRVDALSGHVLQELQRVRKTGFTLAPEAGSQRMRDIIQKEYKEEELIEAARLIFAQGWRSLKLYFMIGLPGETDEDVLAIVALCRKVAAASGARAEVTASVSTFVPKPHTPFQWVAQIDAAETRARQGLLRRELARYRIRFKWHDAQLSSLEGVFSRGDRRLATLVLAAYRLGCRFDGWTEHCRWDLWERAMAECEVDAAFHLRRRLLDEVLPWDHLYGGVTKKYLRQELARAVEGRITPDCSIERCTYCGACDFTSIRNVSYHLRGAKGGQHLGSEVDDWARAQLPEVDSWETKSWREAQGRLATHAARAAQARGAAPPVERLLDPIRVAGVDTASPSEAILPRGQGNAEEWLEGAEPTSQPQTSMVAARAPRRARIRLCYTKHGPARHIGSRELAELFYRATRRAKLPMAFTEGHHPLPRLSFGPGLPLGIASEEEFVDLDLTAEMSPAAVARDLDAQLPEGMRVLRAWSCPLDAPGLASAIESFTYLVQLPGSPASRPGVAERVAAFQQAQTFPVTKRGKGGVARTVDARPTTQLRLRDCGDLELEIRWSHTGTLSAAAIVGALLDLDHEGTRRLDITKSATRLSPAALPDARTESATTVT
jgi:radical SAM family uncharacterized protein/radical SAM-linked protein